MSTIVEMKNIDKHFGGIYALNNVSFALEEGSIHALLGENGAGKSTLMKLLGGIIKKDRGSILIEGKEVEIKDTVHSQELGIAFVPQELSLVSYFTVAENIFLGREPLKKGKVLIDWKKLYSMTKKLLDDLKINLDPKAMVKDLSVSDQQMLVIARILSQDAKIIIMDEPTARLGFHEIERLLEYIKYLKAQGKSIIYISHILEEVFRISDGITVLRDGQLVGTSKTSEITEKELIKMMVNRDVSRNVECRSQRNIGEEVLIVQDLKRRRSSKPVNFSVKRGEVLGFFGLVGAGRTETIRSMLGVDKKASGRIFLNEREIALNSMIESMKEGIVLVPEERRQQGVVLNLSIRKNVTLGNLKKFSRVGLIDKGREAKFVNGIIDKMRVSRNSIEQNVSDLSGGNQQKVVLSKVMAREVNVFILDEPTRGIDVGAKSEIYTLIDKIARDGTPVIVISSEIPELQSICDRIIVMREGEITGELSKEEMLNSENILQLAIGV